jgi:hypothetical protein
MLAQYGVDTLDPATSLRRVKVLAERLRPGMWSDPEHEMSWSAEAYLLAQLIDEVAALTHLTARAHGAKPARPKPFPRPGARPAQRPPEKQRSGWAAFADTLIAASGGEPGKVVIHDGR